ncbi:unnamed protein product [Amoebophrya sp. A120]|nr:unnamed protein product [Amoebophrya sp. A120]|eukprot:GSA120T00006922001.1
MACPCCAQPPKPPSKKTTQYNGQQNQKQQGYYPGDPSMEMDFDDFLSGDTGAGPAGPKGGGGKGGAKGGKGGGKGQAAVKSEVDYGYGGDDGYEDDDYFDQVNLINHATGQIIAQGDDEVREWIDKEKALRKKWGDHVFFNVFRMNVHASSRSQVQQRLTPTKPNFASGAPKDAKDKIVVPAEKIEPNTTVSKVKKMLREQWFPQQGIRVENNERLTFYVEFIMEDQQYFWEDYPMVLPVFVTVWVHAMPLSELKQFLQKLP